MIPLKASRFSPRHDKWLSNKPRSLSNTLQKYFSFFKICLLTILFHIHSYCKVDYCFWTDPDFKSRRHNTFCLLFRELSIYRLLIQEARNDSRENCLDIKFLLSVSKIAVISLRNDINPTFSHFFNKDVIL